MKPEIFLGLDVGTSSLKATCFDAGRGNLTENKLFSYQITEGRPGIIPVVFYERVVLEALNYFDDKYSILGVGVSTQMYSILRNNNEVLEVVQWNAPWQISLEDKEKLKPLLVGSGCHPDVLYPVAKIFSSLRNADNFLPYGIKEHLIEFLTGNRVTDYSTASASGFFLIKEKKWNEELVSMLGFDLKHFPEVLLHNQKAGSLRKELKVGSSAFVVPAAGDGISASLAVADLSSLCGNLGTSMAIRKIRNSDLFSRHQKEWIYALDEERYVTGGISLNGFSVLNWAEKSGFPVVMDKLQPTDLLFFPWLNGEATPFWNENLRGILLGINPETSKEAISSAIRESVAFTFCLLNEFVGISSGSTEPLILGGGGVHHKDILQVIAGVIGQRAFLLKESDYLASIGAARSAAESVDFKLNPEFNLIEEKPLNRFSERFENWKEMALRLSEL